MRQLPAAPPDRNLIVGADTGDDAGVYRLNSRLALVQTADFFTPIVDDAFAYGQIAAANSLSDVYAMGGTPINALNLLGIPFDKMAPPVIARILAGGLSKTTEAGCALLGGHTLRLPEPVYGMAVTGIVAPKDVIRNSTARRGDLIVLTKPLGTGVVTTGVKLGKASARITARAIRSMSHLNRAGAELGPRRLVHAGTDVTGFGLIGHLRGICRQSGVGAELEMNEIPTFGREVFHLMDLDCVPAGTRQNVLDATGDVDWGNASRKQQWLLADAQTSGGLLLCVPPRNIDAVTAILKSHRSPCVKVIGRIVGPKSPSIRIVA